MAQTGTVAAHGLSLLKERLLNPGAIIVADITTEERPKRMTRVLSAERPDVRKFILRTVSEERALGRHVQVVIKEFNVFKK